MLKKFYILATAAMVLAGCAKDMTPVKDEASKLKPIAFTTYTQGATKADVTTDNLAQINVVAYHKGTGSSASYSKYFTETISKAEGQFVSTYYWPGLGTVKFYASNKTLTADDSGEVYIQTDAVDDDIVVANTAEISCPQSNAVSLSFSHVFAKLVVNAKVADAEAFKARIDKIELVTKAPSKYIVTAESDKWKLAENANTVEYFVATSATINSATAQELALDKVYVAPQTGVTAKIYYDVQDKNDFYLKYHSVDPATIEGLAFEEGKITVLNLTFNADKISFTATVNDFGAGTPTDISL